MRSRRARLVGLVLACSVSLPVSAAGSSEDPVVQEVLDILKQRGIVDEGEHARLTAKNRRFEAEQERRFPQLEFFGDLRVRYEGYWYDRDNADVNRNNRHRGRYRLRFGARTWVNDYVGMQFRLSSGALHDSRNESFGGNDDFAPDFIGIDQAFVRIAPFPQLSDTVEAGVLELQIGKLPNPFRWKVGRDFLWDSDITPEGVALVASGRPLDGLQLFLNTGYFVIDEESGSQDPHVFGLQGGAELAVHEHVQLGARASWYSFHSLDAAFLDRQADEGNLVDGLAGDSAGDHAADVVEVAGYAKLGFIPDWPIVVYGSWTRNLDAEESQLFQEADSEGTGWNIGVEIGDKKKWVKLGGGYWYWESNFFPARFVDSDILDGKTNRSGFGVYGSRQILPNTDLNFSLFLLSDEIEDFPGARASALNRDPFTESVRDAERVRFRADLVVAF